MTTEHPAASARDAGVENLFETVFKGYAKRQVEDYIAWLQEQVSAAKAELTDARRELAVAREDLVSTRAQLQTRPHHEEISVRMKQILRLAEEEAQQERDQATPQAGTVLEQARGEARAALESAQESAAEIVRTARRECDDELASARAEANRLVETAHRQAETTLADAKDRAQRALADADRRTEQITVLQQRRLAAVLAAHADAVHRLEAVRGVLGEVLVQDREQGDPGADIDVAPLPAAGAPLDPVTLHPAPTSGRPDGPRPEEHGAGDDGRNHMASDERRTLASPDDVNGRPAVTPAPPIPFPASAPHAATPSGDVAADHADELDDVEENGAEIHDLLGQSGAGRVAGEGKGTGAASVRRAAVRPTRPRKAEGVAEASGVSGAQHRPAPAAPGRQTPSPQGTLAAQPGPDVAARSPRNLLPSLRPEHDGLLGGLDS